MGIKWMEQPRLQSYYTVQQCVGMVRTALDTNDNEKIEDNTIRHLLNLCKTELAEKLSINGERYYGFLMNGQIERLDTFITSNFDYIDLELQINTDATSPLYDPRRPYQHIYKLETISLKGYGIGIQSPLNGLLQAQNNDMFKKSILWCFHGNRLYIHIGSEIKHYDIILINDDGVVVEKKIYYEFEIFGYRYPLLDDLRPPTNGNYTMNGVDITQELIPTHFYPESITYKDYIDVPIKHVGTLIQMVQRKCLEALGKIIDPNLEMTLTQSLNNINQLETKNQSPTKG